MILASEYIGRGVRTKTWTPPGLRKELKNVFEEAG